MLTYMSLVQIRSPIRPGLPNPATLMFNRLARGILPKFSRPTILCNNDESNLTVLINRQPQLNENIDTCKNIPSESIESTLVVH